MFFKYFTFDHGSSWGFMSIYLDGRDLKCQLIGKDPDAGRD